MISKQTSHKNIRVQGPASKLPTCKREADELHTLLAHNRPAEAAVVAAVTDAELIPTVWTERDILVIDPRHHGLFYCFGKNKTKIKQTEKLAILKRGLVREKDKQNECEQNSRVTSYLSGLSIRSVKCSELTRRKQCQMELNG